jgi:hypothetical protein
MFPPLEPGEPSMAYMVRRQFSYAAVAFARASGHPAHVWIDGKKDHGRSTELASESASSRFV